MIALVRNVGRLPERPGLRIVGGDVRDTQTLAAVADKADALVSTLGVGRTRNPDNLVLDTMRAVTVAAEQADLRRVVVQSAFGVGASYAKSSILMRLGYHLAPAVFRDKAAGEDVLMDTDLNWTIAYPGALTHGPRTGKVVATDLHALKRLPGVPRISRADVADFLLDAVTTETWIRRVAVLTANS